ncbi:conserved hypothetical protein [Caldicellulosiruptor hydrothermalis 108]|uniref:Lipoprotein YerB n=1 Tax=Caldicellulosiruptor hydrothermalis (strain DSM 18901 / VKM B-2411 / 108) TaxID=632292 RepID=E4QB74_CALH1|nr:DUF3048 domain-containing protein [Caldicellulosiruptor hydrothermalis]ADQ07167.1 conserved hypothetical protein [Caldicellulosiruptor hydrothermalis 108]
MKDKKGVYLKKILSLIIIGMIIFSLSACGKKETKNEISKTSKTLQTDKKEGKDNSQAQQFDYLCRFTGDAIYQKDEHQIIAVMINNEPGAIPQSSLNQAEYLYEALIEGGATRIMAIYHHTYPKKVGPIRSARPYFMQIAKSLNAYFVHCGGSPQAYRLFKQNFIPHIDAIYTGGGIFFRTSDRKAPHNLYSSMEKLTAFFDKKGYTTQKTYKTYPLTDDVVNKWNSENTRIKITFSGWYYVRYEYDAQKKVYKRFIKEKPHLDKETGVQLTAKNLVIIFAHYDTIKNDDKGRQEVDFSKGKGYVLQMGKTIPITYEFNMENSFILKDENGQEIKLLKGNTWFEIVPQYGKVKIE